MKRIIAIILCGALAIGLSGCNAAQTLPHPTRTDAAQTASDNAVPQPAFTFQPKVTSSFLEETLGKPMCDAWFSLVDAVMAGEDTFACPDGHTYDWVMWQFRDKCFPVLVDIIDKAEDDDDSIDNGVARFVYTVSKKEAAQKIQEFKTLVEGILNEVLQPEYTDFEKALALYRYFSHAYKYDYEMAESIKSETGENPTAYRLLTTKTGICVEVATAYSYLLMQAGVEASVVSARSDEGENHAWSIIRLGDKYYHIDPTFVMENEDYLGYFLMDDEKRYLEGHFAKENFVYVSEYSPEYMPDYTADDDSFACMQDGFLDSFDHASKTLEYIVYDDSEQPHTHVFDYSAY